MGERASWCIILRLKKLLSEFVIAETVIEIISAIEVSDGKLFVLHIKKNQLKKNILFLYQ